MSVFDRRDELCNNPLDSAAIGELTDILRDEYVKRPLKERTYGSQKKDVSPDLSLVTFYRSDGAIDNIGGIAANVKCAEKSHYVQVDLDEKGNLRSVNIAQNGRWIAEISISGLLSDRKAP